MTRDDVLAPVAASEPLPQAAEATLVGGPVAGIASMNHPAATAAERAADLRLARLHLRLGALDLARAELAAAAGEVPLDEGPLLDLAEARWRTGDLAGAGVAAEVWLDAGREGTLATVIAVEASMAHGRPSDARLRLDALPATTPDDLDAVFNGMPRSAVWPAEEGPGPAIAAGALPDVVAGPPAGPRHAAGQRAAGETNPVAELEAALAQLEAGESQAAAVRLSVALRLAPHLAPAVLELLEGASGPMLDLVRGDAYRLVGRETEAEREWRGAASEAAGPAPAARAGGVGARERRASEAAGITPLMAVPVDARPASADPAREPGAPAPESEETP